MIKRYKVVIKRTILALSALLAIGTASSFAQGPFCGAVGTEGCDAVSRTNPGIIGWAVSCTVVRGPVDIVNPDGPVVRYGDESMALGPATTATTRAVSLGDGGSATVTFERPIRNGEGPDFAVFENPFNDYFLELGFVEVSTDGERFVRFPATSLSSIDTQVVSYVDPTNIHNLAGKYKVGYGTPFDLEELRDSTGIDIDSIVYVRIVDVVGTIDPQYARYDAYGHIINDPYPTNDTIWASGGFDLTGVAVLYDRGNLSFSPLSTLRSPLAIYPNPATDRISIRNASGQEAVLCDMAGHRLKAVLCGNGETTIDVRDLPNGVYILRIGATAHKIVKR